MIGPFRVRPDAILPFTVNMAPAIPTGATIDEVRLTARTVIGGDDVTSQVIVDPAPTPSGLKVTFEYQRLVDGLDYEIEVLATLDTGSPANVAVETVLLQCRR